MAKLDLKSAYRMVLIHPGDRWLLGISDQALPSPLDFVLPRFLITDALAWVLRGVINVP